MNSRHRGTKNFKARLTETNVKTIYLSKGKITQRVLSEKYSVSKATIAHIWTGRSWAWLTAKLENEVKVASLS